MSQSEEQSMTEHQRWLYEQNRSMAERAHDRQEQSFQHMNETAISASHVALRTLLLINGGAAIALLSFDGRLPPLQARAVAATLVWFSLGVVATAIAMALAYFTHFCMAGGIASIAKSYEHPFVSKGPKTSQWERGKLVCHILSAVFAAVSMSLFVIGMFAVRAALLA